MAAEAAAGGRPQGIGGFPAKHHPPALPLRIGNRNRGEKRPSIRMLGRVIEPALFSDLDNAAEIHDGDLIGYVLHHTEVMRDEEIGETPLPL